MNDSPERKRSRLKELEAEATRLRRELNLTPEPRPLQQGLSKREALLVEAERVAHLGSWVWDLRNDEIDWSDEFYRILGLSPSQVMPTSEAFFAAIHEEDRARVRQIVTRSIETGVPEPIEHRVVRPDGEIRQVRLEAAFLNDAQGQRTHVVGTALDDTERLQVASLLTETIRELDEAQRIAGLGSWRWDRRLRRADCSKGMYRLFGLADSTRPTEAVFFEHVHPDDRDRLRAALRSAMASGTALSAEFRIVLTPAVTRHVTMEAQPRLSPEGEVLGFHGVVQDVTDRKLLEDRLSHSQKMEAVGTLAGGVAHDFNNYLTAIAAHTELIEGQLPAGDPARESVAAIGEACKRCADLTQQLLTLSRKRKAEPRRLNLTAQVEQLLPTVRAVLGATISLTPQLSRASTLVFADPIQLEQALMNLVLNARDAMPEGGQLTLRVDAASAEAVTRLQGAAAGEHYVRLTLSDTGHGMSEDVRSRVFEPFFTTKGVGRGTGLGLSTVYGIVQQAAGAIEVESQPNQGTTFHLYFPALPEGGQPLTSQTLPPGTSRRGWSVLVVEDVPNIRTLLCTQLARAGYRVRGAQDGLEALALLQQELADLVVSDVIMPNLGGVELVREVRQRHPGVRCVLMTGYADEMLEGVGDDMAAHLLRKPFNSSKFLATVERALEAPSDIAGGRARLPPHK